MKVWVDHIGSHSAAFNPPLARKLHPLFREVVASAPYLHESNLNLVVADSPPLIHNPFVQIHDVCLWLSGQSPVTEWLGLD